MTTFRPGDRVYLKGHADTDFVVRKYAEEDSGFIPYEVPDWLVWVHDPDTQLFHLLHHKQLAKRRVEPMAVGSIEIGTGSEVMRLTPSGWRGVESMNYHFKTWEDMQEQIGPTRPGRIVYADEGES